MNRRRLLALGAALGAGRLAQAAFGQFYTPTRDTNGSWSFKADPALPNVLLIGDSISIGYTRDVRRLLQGQANVYRPMQPGGTKPANCGNTKEGLAELNSWLGDRRWQVIHFKLGAARPLLPQSGV